MNKNKNAALPKRFRFALNGISNAFKRERSLRTQSAALVLLIAFCIWSQPSAIWCGVFASISALVLSLEMVNSALESLLDRFHPSEDSVVGYAKDCLAGAVLIASTAGIIILTAYCYERYS